MAQPEDVASSLSRVLSSGYCSTRDASKVSSPRLNDIVFVASVLVQLSDVLVVLEVGDDNIFVFVLAPASMEGKSDVQGFVLSVNHIHC